MNFKKLIALLLAACMLLGLLTACGKADPSETDASTEASDPTEDVTALSNYAVTEASPHDANMSAVIAVDADGNPAMTNSMLQFIYWLQFFNFMNSYGSYASYFGLDPYTPLAEQPSMAAGLTWEQYFLADATDDFAQQYALYRAAQDAGYTVTDDEQAQLDDILDPNGGIATGAASNGYDSADAFIQDSFGSGIDLQDYYDYVLIYLTANSYYSAAVTPLVEQYENADEAALGDFFDEHAAFFAAKNVRKVNNVSVRHILIQPEGEQDAEGNYSEAAWAAAEATAKEILAQWQENPTEENFGALANERSSDPGSNTVGGLYEDFDSSKMVAEFTEWSFDPARSYGDTGIVKTTYGYHIMFYVGKTENKGWVENVRSLVEDALLYDICSAYPVTFYYSKMRVFDLVSLMAAQEPVDVTEDTPIETVILPEDTFEP